MFQVIYCILLCNVFRLLETCTKGSYCIEENVGPGAQRLAFEVRIYRAAAVYGWATPRQTALEVFHFLCRFYAIFCVVILHQLPAVFILHFYDFSVECCQPFL